MTRQIKKNKLLLCLLLFAVIFSSCEETDDTPVTNNEIIELTVLNEGLSEEISGAVGDGTTIIALKAKIPHNAAGKFKSITFKASKGAFVTATTTPLEILKQVDTEGVAIAYLKVPLDYGELFVSAQIGDLASASLYADEKVIVLTDVNDVITLDLLDNALQPLTQPVRADGNTILALKATMHYNTVNLNSVTFLNSAGSGNFLDVSNTTTIALDNNNDAIIRFRVSKTVGEIYFRAQAGSNAQIYKSGGLTLVRSYADHIIVEPNVLTVASAADGINLITYLLKNVGSVSTSTSVQYAAYQLDDSNNQVSAGRFTGLSQAFTDADGKISAVNFRPDTGDVDFDKPIYITATTGTDSGAQISKTIIVNTD